MKHNCLPLFLILFYILSSIVAFRPSMHDSKGVQYCRQNKGVRGMTQFLDIFAGLTIATQLNNAPLNPQFLQRSTLPVAVLETKQGLYKEYTVEKIDDSALDRNIKTYKTAEETEDSKTKYWAILGVLLAGSFIIPMVQYYWYALFRKYKYISLDFIPIHYCVRYVADTDE